MPPSDLLSAVLAPGAVEEVLGPVQLFVHFRAQALADRKAVAELVPSNKIPKNTEVLSTALDIWPNQLKTA